MPCYEVNLVSVEFKAENRELLLRALTELKWNFVVDERNNQISMRGIALDLNRGEAVVEDGRQGTLNLLKQAYSKEVIKKVAQVKRWSLNQNQQGNKFQLRRVAR